MHPLCMEMSLQAASNAQQASSTRQSCSGKHDAVCIYVQMFQCVCSMASLVQVWQHHTPQEHWLCGVMQTATSLAPAGTCWMLLRLPLSQRPCQSNWRMMRGLLTQWCRLARVSATVLAQLAACGRAACWLHSICSTAPGSTAYTVLCSVSAWPACSQNTKQPDGAIHWQYSCWQHMARGPSVLCVCMSRIPVAALAAEAVSIC